MRIGVIGLGVAGSLLAEGLADQPGIDVAVFEQARFDDHAEAGTGLNLGPNALKALRLFAPTRHAAVRAASLPWRRWAVSLVDGTPLLDLGLLDLADDPGARIRWSELYRVLRAPLAAMAHTGMALEAMEEDAAGRLAPVFRSGAGSLVRQGSFDLLVAADGRYSCARALAAGAPKSEMLGVCLWRLLVRDASDCPFEDYGQWFNGPNRLLAFRIPGDAVYVAGAFPLGGDGQIPDAAQTVAAQRAMFLPQGRPPCPAVAWMLNRMEAGFDGIHWARLQSSPVLRHALDGRLLLLGDAAHGMAPTLGQGATQAVEDGVLAAAVLRGGGGAAAFAVLREERVRFARDFSVEASDTLLAGSDPVTGTLAKGGASFRTKLRRLWTDVPDPGIIANICAGSVGH